jgi:uroporphyrin-III C-methyltransferase/precorrin-2 dehydrogenase/sirohydrochlorin ferrochelatase
VFVTGNLRDGTIDLDWDALARPRQTVVIYMGFANLPALCDALVAHGMAATMPAAVVQQGTTPDQKVVTGTLGSLPELAHAAGLTPPTLIIVGEVVRLRDRLSWFEPGEAVQLPVDALRSTA